jgi:hypothetical protein
MSEGEIFYSIDYIRNPFTLSKDFLPKELVISFKDDMISTELTSPIGNAGITIITNPGSDIYDTYVNMLAFKFCYEGKPKHLSPGFSTMKDLSFRETGRESQICGFSCKELEARILNDSSTFHVWYTDEIDIKNPNQLTPFHEIDGVLMDFFYVIGDAEMRFKARQIYFKEVPAKNFERKKNYKSVSEGYLDSLILKMIAL